MNIIRNYFYNSLYQILILLTPLITVPYVSRVLGPETIGKQVYTITFAQYFIILGLVGMDTYATRQVAYKRDHDKKLRCLFWEIFYIRALSVLISLLLYLILFVVINKNDRFIYLLQSLNIIAVIFDISWYFIGIEEFKRIVLRNSIVKVIGISFIFIFVNSTKDLNRYILILSLTQLIGHITMWRKIPKFISIYKLNRKCLKNHFKCSIRLFIPQLTAQVYLLLDKTMLGFFIGTTSVGVYETSQRIVRLVLPIVTSLGTVMIPRMSNLFINGQIEKLKENTYFTFSCMNFIAIPMSLGLISISTGIIPWFFGEQFEGIDLLMKISSFIIIFGTWCNLAGFQLLIPLGKDREFTISVMIGAILNIMLNAVLINKYKEVGVAFASILAEFVVPIVQFYFLRHILELKTLFSSIWKNIFGSIIMSLCVVSLYSILPISPMLTFVQVIVGLGIYLILMVVMKDKNVRFLFLFINNRFNSR